MVLWAASVIALVKGDVVGCCWSVVGVSMGVAPNKESSGLLRGGLILDTTEAPAGETFEYGCWAL